MKTGASDAEIAKTPPMAPSLWSFKSRRLIVALLMMVAVYCGISSKTHMGVAMVCMVNASAIHRQKPIVRSSASERDDFCARQVSSAVSNSKELGNDAGYKGTFVWSPEQQSVIFGGSFYGSLLIMFFSGYAISKMSPKLAVFGSVLGFSATMALSPVAANLSHIALVIVRVFGGVFETFSSVALAAIVPRWFPVTERSTVAGIYTSGYQLATSLGVFVASNLCRIDLFGGWPFIFYLAAVIGLIWAVTWWLVFEDSPADSLLLSSEEKIYLQAANHAQGLATERSPVPWKSMFRSIPLWAVVFAHIPIVLGNTIFNIYLPSYARDVLALNLKENGMFTAFPFALQFLSKNALGILADHLKKKGILSPTASCKVFHALMCFGIIVTFVSLALYVDCTRITAALVILSFYGFCYGAIVPGITTCFLSLAPAFSGTVASFVLAAVGLGAAAGPTVAGFFIRHATPDEYATVFLLIAAFNVVGGAVFIFLGDASVQPWATVSTSEKVDV